MTTTQVTRTEQADTITYTATVAGVDAAELVIWTATRGVANVETLRDYQRQGLATTLWQAANAEAECYHALDHHRTAEGEAFARSVGGDTLSAEDDYQPTCCICTDGEF